MSKKHCIVAGGAGFLGSSLCEYLLSRGNRVTCIDNLYTGYKGNIAHLLGTKDFEFRHHNVCEPLSYDGAVDEIYNLACPASPPAYQQDPIFTTKTSVLGALNLLELATTKSSKILQASTSEIYGDPVVHPQPESYRGNVSTTGIRACYDEGKRCAETLFYDYHRQLRTRIRVARIFNTYGPRMSQNDGRVVSNFIVQALKGDEITIYGDGNQSRSFCYCDDLIDGLVRLMNAGDDVIFPVNLGNPVEFTILELADLVCKLTKSKSRLTYRPLPQDDPIQRCPSISTARTYLNWEPKVSLEDGLVRTIDYFERTIGAGALGVVA